MSLKTIGKLEHKSRPRCYLRTCMSIAAALGIDPKGIAVTHNRGM